MALSAGTRLGPFEVISALGAGGMGEVYRARDTRLDRPVAIKVLPEGGASDPELLRRFEKEARAASSLNHPNIVTLYEVGREGSVSYIAMELVEGRTLRQLLTGEALPMKRVLGVAAQIADGLAKAHASGIVHRDLKPENVMVTGDGLVKVLDFGLAKLTRAEAESGADLTHTPTVSAPTGPGVVMGTVGYMSPEQAVGKAVDFRSDQFALGAIVYEMATGRRAFARETAPEILSAIIRDEPEPIAALNPKTPVPLRWIVERCLAKAPKERYASTEDLARDLAAVRDHLSEASGSGVAEVAAPVLRRMPAVAAALLLAAVSAAATYLLVRKAGPGPPPSFKRLTFRRGTVERAFFAPDGQTIVYSAQWGSEPMDVYTTRAGGVESRSLGLPGGIVQSISSAGELLILRGQTLARVDLAGGTPREVLEGCAGADWAPNGKDIAVVRSGATGRLEFPIGRVLYQSSRSLTNPRVSPRGDRIAVLERPHASDNRASVAVVDLEGRKRTLTTELNAIDLAVWSPRGDEIWYGAQSAAEASSGFGIHAVTLSGRDRVVASTAGDLMVYAVSADGRALVGRMSGAVFIKGLGPGTSRERELSWLDSSFPVDISSDGSTLLFREEGEAAGSASYGTYLRKMDGSPAVRLGDGDASAISPDGKWALAVLHEPPPAQLVLLPTGAGEARPLTRDAIDHLRAAFFPDGKRVLFSGRQPGETASRLFVQDLEGGAPRAITPPGIQVGLAPRPRPISGDGKLVFCQVAGQPRLLPTDGGEPRPIPGLLAGEMVLQWSADGRSLYVRRLPSFEISLLDLASGTKKTWKTIAPADETASNTHLVLSPGGESYAYWYSRWSADLYLAKGLR